MDALAGLLADRTTHISMLRVVMAPPWGISIEDRSPLSLMAVTHGSMWIHQGTGPPRHLHAGDIALVKGPVPYCVSDDPATDPTIRVLPGQNCQTLDGASLVQALSLGVRTWGNAIGGSTVMLIGTYEAVGAVGQRMLDALPDLVVVDAAALDSPLVPLLAAEIGKDQPGQQVVLERLIDLLIVAVVRAWLSSDDAEPSSGWFGAHDDPVVGRALRLLHDHPGEPWTVGALAREAGASRAAFARRFTELVGEPPVTYLTAWRLSLAADLLDAPGATVTSVAREVGYSTPFALSAAFKRVRGISPSQHQRRERPHAI